MDPKSRLAGCMADSGDTDAHWRSGVFHAERLGVGENDADSHSDCRYLFHRLEAGGGAGPVLGRLKFRRSVSESVAALENPAYARKGLAWREASRDLLSLAQRGDKIRRLGFNLPTFLSARRALSATPELDDGIRNLPLLPIIVRPQLYALDSCRSIRDQLEKWAERIILVIVLFLVLADCRFLERGREWVGVKERE